jgi:hypothetical protein
MTHVESEAKKLYEYGGVVFCVLPSLTQHSIIAQPYYDECSITVL